jgi:predicted AAA+ superfamily ATPase
VVHIAVDGWRAEELRALISGAGRSFLAGVSVPRYWFLDEITSVVGDWPSTIKNLRDTDPDFARDTIVLTGSSAAGLHEARKAFAGRRGRATNADRAMLPMRFTDIVNAAGLDIPAVPPVRVRDLGGPENRDRVNHLLPHVADLVPLWETYLRVGGFPQAVAGWLRAGEPERSFVEALWDVVYGDAIRSARFAATQVLTLLASLSRGLCSPLNVADLARDLGVAQTTASERVSDLADHFLVWPCFREQGQTARPSARRKWYFTDPLLARLAALRGAGAEPDLTQLSQQQIGVCLLRNVGAEDAVSLADFDSVMHYRTQTGAEIDYVGPRLGRIVIESKYVDDRWGREMQTIRASGRFGIVASRSGVEWRDDGWVVPTSILALLLGG